jgi:acetyl esterase
MDTFWELLRWSFVGLTILFGLLALLTFAKTYTAQGRVSFKTALILLLLPKFTKNKPNSLTLKFIRQNFRGIPSGNRVKMAEQYVKHLMPDNLALHVYKPLPQKDLPVLIFYHGGGFVVGWNAAYHEFCKLLSHRTGWVVVAPEYRLAPEHPFPAAVDDSYAAYRWVIANAASIGGDATKIAVAGDSAGGNLAAVVCQMAINNNIKPPDYQVLYYPTLSPQTDTDSHKRLQKGYMLSGDLYETLRDMYLPKLEELKKQYPENWVAPLQFEHFNRLPSTYVATCEFDILHDDGMLFVEKLKQAGVKTQHKEIKGSIHGLLSIPFYKKERRQLIEQTATFINA